MVDEDEGSRPLALSLLGWEFLGYRSLESGARVVGRSLSSTASTRCYLSLLFFSDDKVMILPVATSASSILPVAAVFSSL